MGAQGCTCAYVVCVDRNERGAREVAERHGLLFPLSLTSPSLPSPFPPPPPPSRNPWHPQPTARRLLVHFGICTCTCIALYYDIYVTHCGFNRQRGAIMTRPSAGCADLRRTVMASPSQRRLASAAA